MLATNRTEAVVTRYVRSYIYIGNRATFAEEIGRVERPVYLVEFSVRKRERDDIRIGTYLYIYIFGRLTECKYYVNKV